MTIGEKFESSILSEIKEKGIKPKARWTFLLKDYLVWATGFLSLVFGAIAFSVIIYLIRNNDWELYEELSGSFLEFIILTMPYFWIIFLALFIFVINYDLKHTKHGYRFSLPLIITLSILASMFLGFIFYGAGLGQMLDDILGKNLSFYDRIINPSVHMWDDPESGRLAGLVIAQVEAQSYRLRDISRREWLIDMSAAKMPDNFSIQVGRPVKLLGEQANTYHFVVERVFLHEGPGRGMMIHRLHESAHPLPEGFLPISGTCGMLASGTDAGTCPMQSLEIISSGTLEGLR